MKLIVGQYWNEKKDMGCIIGELALLAGISKNTLIRLNQDIYSDQGPGEREAIIHEIYGTILNEFSYFQNSRNRLMELLVLNDKKQFRELREFLGPVLVKKIELAQEKRWKNTSEVEL